MTIPPDTRAPGQAGHIADHNNIADVLTSLQDQINSILSGGLTTQGDVDIAQAGHGLKVAEGSNARQGTAVLVAGQVVVSNTTVTASTRIQVTIQAPGGSVGSAYVFARTPGASFTIKSTSGSDTSTVAYLMTEPG